MASFDPEQAGRQTRGPAQQPAPEYDSLERLFERHRAHLVVVAAHKIRRLGVDQADIDADGALDLAFVELRDARDRGPAVTSGCGDEFLKLMTVIVDRILNDCKQRSGARKRTGRVAGVAGPEPGDAGANNRAEAARRRTDIDLDQLASSQPPVDDEVAAKLDSESFLETLPDDHHRHILTLLREGQSIQDISVRLGLSRKTVERKLRYIRQTFRRWRREA
jgi:DNA-directed RNA polymerase specialized sigma24 family protein